MNYLGVIGQRIFYAVAAFVTLAAFISPSIVAAAQVNERSVRLSSSSTSATNTTYEVSFTSVGAAGAFVLDFCSNSPLIGQDCTAPAGFNASSASSATPGFTDVTGATSQVIVAGAIGAATPVTVAIDGITNPSTAGPLYARIVTYDTKLNAQNNYSATSVGAGAVDEGGVAISITPTIAVTGMVLETLTFCVSGVEIGANCTGTQSPVLELGEAVGEGVVALQPGVISDGTIHTQISTNAASGAVIRLKSNATDCGGLLRAGAAPGTCDILPALNEDIDVLSNEAKFGVKTAAAVPTTGVSNANGTLVPYSGSFYNNTTYALNYIDGNEQGITSTFGDPFLSTNGLPANNQNMALTFGATVSNNTPAGLYSADISLIAVGRF